MCDFMAQIFFTVAQLEVLFDFFLLFIDVDPFSSMTAKATTNLDTNKQQHKQQQQQRSILSSSSNNNNNSSKGWWWSQWYGNSRWFTNNNNNNSSSGIIGSSEGSIQQHQVNWLRALSYVLFENNVITVSPLSSSSATVGISSSGNYHPHHPHHHHQQQQQQHASPALNQIKVSHNPNNSYDSNSCC